MILKILCLLALIFAFDCRSIENDELWQSYKQTFQKIYATPREEYMRWLQWSKTRKVIGDNYYQYMANKTSYLLGLTPFLDVSPEEMLLPIDFIKVNQAFKTGKLYTKSSNLKKFPKTLDWRKMGCVTPVKSQGLCNANWAYSAIGAIEGRICKEFGKTHIANMSAQQLLDCDKSGWANGCFGGLPVAPYIYTEIYGLEKEKDYPFKGFSGSCNYNRSLIYGRSRGYIAVSTEVPEVTQQVLFENGPLSVMMSILPDFLYYKSGVYDNPNCTPFTINNAALLVGYGTYKGKDYWLIKNSWGTKWGMKGYAMVARHQMRCGITSYASFPVI